MDNNLEALNLKYQKHNIEQFEIFPDAKAGIFVLNMDNREVGSHNISRPHRDDHCQLMIALSGNFRLNIDFENVEFTGPALLFVSPEQVHYIMEVKNPHGWMFNIDASLINEELLQIIENKIRNPLILQNGSAFHQQLASLTALIENIQLNKSNHYTEKIMHSLVNGLLGIIAGEIVAISPIAKEKENRGVLIKEKFIKLLKEHFKNWKQPAEYASALSISTSHLNDTVKSLTGGSVSTHIQAASIMEAKRLLYFTDGTVKEIAYKVGYDEPAYFGKLFKKITNLTPLEFRNKFRD